MTFLRMMVVAVCVPFLASAARAQNQWNLTGGDFQTRQVELRGVDNSGVSVARTSSATVERVPWDQVLQLVRDTSPRVATGRFILVAVGGERLYGHPVKIQEENLVWSTPSLGDVSLPLRQVALVTRVSRPQLQQQLQSKSRGATTEPHTEDAVSLANGDVVKGIISDIGNGNVIVQSNGSPVNVPLDSVDAVTFAAPAEPERSRERSFRVRFADGSTVRTGSELKLAGDRLEIHLPDKTSKSIDIANVASIEQVNGPVAWLSGLEPAENLHTPYLQTGRPARMDRSVTGDPIRFGDKTYARGIGVYPYSRLTWNLDGTYAGFRTRYAIDGSGPYANVTVRVKLDGKVVHEQPNFTAGQLSPIVVVPLEKAKTITLEVDYGENFSVQDKFNWIEPALTRTVIQPAPATQP